MSSNFDAVAASGAIGYSFERTDLLRRALTHPSAPAVIQDGAPSYQRLEFLGDRVLGLVVADLVFSHFSEADEGELSRRLTQMVRKETCAEVAKTLGIGDHVIMGDGEARSGGRRKRAILGDVCESVIAAIYLDGEMPAARTFIERNWQTYLLKPARQLRDAKSALQEWTHKAGKGVPNYALLDQTGPDHRPIFKISVSVPDHGSISGEGSTKRDAEQEAAQAFLVREGVWSRDKG